MPGACRGTGTVKNGIHVADNGNVDIANDCPLGTIKGMPPGTNKGCLPRAAEGSAKGWPSG